MHKLRKVANKFDLNTATLAGVHHPFCLSALFIQQVVSAWDLFFLVLHHCPMQPGFPLFSWSPHLEKAPVPMHLERLEAWKTLRHSHQTCEGAPKLTSAGPPTS